MADYKGIQGYSVQTLASDPSPAANVLGQLWYNSTSATYKLAAAGAGAWSSGGNLSAAKHSPGGAGTQTAALCMGGILSPGSPMDESESYDGTSWTEGNNLNAAIAYNTGIGSQTAALSCGGTSASTVVQSYDGTSWSEGTAMNTGRGIAAGAGIQTGALMFGGGEPQIDNTETWNGSTWTEVGDLSGVRMGMAGFGATNTAAICAGGRPSPPISRPDLDLNLSETWNGSSWSEGNNLNTARRFLAGSGTTTAGIVFGGATTGPGSVKMDETEQYDGTSWTEVADMATARQAESATSSPSSLSLAFGGQTPLSNLTEEWNGAPVTVKTVTAS